MSSHVVSEYAELLDALTVVRSRDLLRCRSKAEVLVAGVKVATQTPPIRSGRRVVFLTLDDSTGPVDATFFEDAQGPYASTVFSTWLLLVRGEVRRTGPRGVSLRATGAWSLPELHALWRDHPTAEEGLAAVRARLTQPVVTEQGPEHRRVLVHSSGFRMSPYADIKPAGVDTLPARALWHRSPGSPG
ncbi:OB-fold nucleic acid binding domain-containing protein [Nocardioides daphniae]|uniref:OB-fold nucleic acid binding domain-containing protein n=1 Tax=Nocardioides daphniae TaxID=402297 RepID=UPI001930EA4C|nr:OB-fold nucleic acid binding domain-containing protein [Nocardioides daphniae]